MKILCTIAALACGLALAAAPARASDRTIPFEVRLADRAVTCADSDLFGIPFDMVSLGGKPLGTGQSCVHSIVGCTPLVPFCHQTVDATFTLAFARGTGDRADDAARGPADREPDPPAGQGQDQLGHRRVRPGARQRRGRRVPRVHGDRRRQRPLLRGAR